MIHQMRCPNELISLTHMVQRRKVVFVRVELLDLDVVESGAKVLYQRPKINHALEDTNSLLD